MAFLSALSGIRAQIAAGLSSTGRKDAGSWDDAFASSFTFGRGVRGPLPGATKNWEALAGDPWMNSTVSIALNWISTSFREAPLCVGRVQKNRTVVPIENHPLELKLLMPNAWYPGQLMWAGILISWFGNGNAYLYKDLSTAGELLGLYYMPHMAVRAVPSKGGKNQIDHYEYFVQGQTIRYAPEQIVHLRYGMDPRRPWMGLSPLAAQMRNIVSDNEADSYYASLLMNFGIPGLYVSPKAVDPDAAKLLKANGEQIKARIMETTTGDKRGEPFISTMPIDISMLGIEPDKMALDIFTQRAESRVCGAFQVPPQVLGLAVGEGMKTYANYEEARLAAQMDCILPTQRDICDQLGYALLGLYRLDPLKFRLFHDTTQVMALQGIHNRRRAQALLEYRGGVAMRAEARTVCGYDVTPEDNVYITDITGQLAPEANPGEVATAAKAIGIDDSDTDAPESWLTRMTSEIKALDGLTGAAT